MRPSPRPLRRTAVVATAASLAVLAVGVVPATALPTVRLAGPKIAPSPAIVAETFAATGSLSTKVVRPVQLQRLVGKKWVKQATGKTTRTGAYTLSGTAQTKPLTTSYRLVAPAAKISHKSYPALTSGVSKLRTVAQKATATKPTSTIYPGDHYLVAATLTPARPGRVVTLQQSLNGTTWSSATLVTDGPSGPVSTPASGVEDAAGHVTLTSTAPAAGTYSYRVTAASAKHAAAVSSPLYSQVVTPRPIGAPGPATGLTLTPSASAPGQGAVQLSWTNPTEPSFSGVTVRRLEGTTPPSGATDGDLVYEGMANGTTDTKAVPDTTYSYAVFAHDTATPAHYAAAATGTTTTPMPPPGRVENLNDVPTSHDVALSWQNPTGTSFAGVTIRRVNGTTAPSGPTAGTPITDTSGTTYDDTSTAPSSTYTYGFFSHDADAAPGASVSLTVTTPSAHAPGPVTSLTSSATDSVATLNWTNPTDADFDGVVIMRKQGTVAPTSTSDGERVATTAANTTAYQDTGLLSATTYSYALFARDLSHTAFASPGTTQVTTLPSAVSAVNASPASVTSGSLVGLSWTNPSTTGLTGVLIRRATGDTAPTSPTDGTLVQDVNSPDSSFTDTGLAPSTDYSYSLFSHVGSSYSTPTSVRVTTPPASTATWHTAQLVDPTHGSPTAVSCPTPTFCMSVDFYGFASTLTNGTWSKPAQVDTTNLNGVACPSTTFCVAVDSAGSALTWNGTSWTVPAPIDTNELLSVACSSASLCLATDSFGNVVQRTSSGWGQPVTVMDDQTSINAITCLAGTPVYCEAVTSVSSDSKPYALTFDGTTWTKAQVPGQRDLTAVACASSSLCAAGNSGGGGFYRTTGSWQGPSPLTSARIAGVSCRTNGDCVAVDQNGAAAVLHANAWGSASSVTQNGFNAISCPDTTCVAMSGTGDAIGFDGTTWGTPTTVDPQGGTPSSVSCPDTGTDAPFCMAVSASGEAFRYDGTGWSDPVPVTGQQLASVSCPTATTCMAVTNSFDAFVWTSGPTAAGTWTSMPSIDTHPLSDVDCPTTTRCVAVDQAGYVTTYNGTTWTAPVKIDTATLISVSCASTTQCAAVDLSGRVTWYSPNTQTATGWTDPASIGFPNDSGASSISCTAKGTSGQFCLASDVQGNVASNGGNGWSDATTLFNSGISSVSCTSSSSCFAVSLGAVREMAADAWGAPTTINNGGTNSAISCSTSQACTAVSREGFASRLG